MKILEVPNFRQNPNSQRPLLSLETPPQPALLLARNESSTLILTHPISGLVQPLTKGAQGDCSPQSHNKQAD